MANFKPIIKQPTFMIYGDRDMIPESQSLYDFAPKLDVVNLDCGHWIQQEKPEETNLAIVKWLERQNYVEDSDKK